MKELLTPFRNTGHLTNNQIRYNTKFSSIRSIIERAFGLLKGKRRRLKFLDMHDMELLNKVIISCCILHNFIICHQGGEADEIDDFVEEEQDVSPIAINERRRHIMGERKREEIMNLL